MSKHTTLDQLEMLARRTKTEIDKVDAKVDTISDKVDGLVATGGEPNVLTAVKVDGTALEITDKAVDIGASISAAVAKADHLKRKKVTGVDAIDLTAADADQYLYMVPKTGSDSDDVYDEYMVLDGKVEHVGNTKIDLSGYALKNELPQMATDDEVSSMLTDIFGAESAA